MSSKHVYFPNLNGLRFIAAALVIIHHIEQAKFKAGLDSLWLTSHFIGIIGKLGVVLFFVLSGFLITYLLLNEEEVNGEISIKKFYLRRIFRIWPLYFLIMGLAFFILPSIPAFDIFNTHTFQSNDLPKVLMYIFFLGNLVMITVGTVPFASHLWSIGTEEQFYIIWPILFDKIKKNRITVFISIIIFLFILQTLLKLIPSADSIWHQVSRFFEYFNIDCMLIGSVFAFLDYQKHRLVSILKKNSLFYVVLIMTMIMLALGIFVPYVQYQLYSVLFGIIILNLATNQKSNINLENKAMKYLGDISFGLYMYHPIAIAIALLILNSMGNFSNILLYPLVFALTIATASISYTYFESYFLKIKNKFSIVTVKK